jgi:hypothetical protein
MKPFFPTVGWASVVCLQLGCATADPPPSAVAWRPAQPYRGEYRYGADLAGADLAGEDLYRWQLGSADLTGADLRGARLGGAYLFKADLSGADLRGASFSSSLKGAELKQTRLTGARFDRTTTLPFSADEAMRRGMVFVATEELATR